MSQQRSPPDEAVAASDRLLEHRMPVNGRQLTLLVTTAGGSAPDAVIIHARYGSGQAELTISADAGSSVTETHGSATGGGGSLPDSGERASRKDERRNVEFARAGRDEDDRVKPAGISDLREDIFQYILSFLTWQQLMGVRRVSRAWYYAVNACLSRRTELRIGLLDFPYFLNNDMMCSLLKAMPSLSCLYVNKLLGGDMYVNIVSRYCDNLVEADLTMFRVDASSLEWLCRVCPGLEVVKLPRKSDDSCVEALLCKLPKLRSLDLANTNVTGRFLETCQDSVEKLSLAGSADSFRRLAEHTAGKGSQTGRWSKVRELNLRKTDYDGPVDVSEMLKYFPALERLSLTSLDRTSFLSYSCSFLHSVRCERLRDLDFSYQDLGCFDLLDVLTRCPQLERLSLAHSSFEESSDLRQLEQGLVLRLLELDVSSTEGLTFSNLRVILLHSPCLERLRASQFANMNLTDCLTLLSKCPELRELDVSRLGTLEEDPLTPSMDQHIDEKISRSVGCITLPALLSGCQKLERLSLAGCHFTAVLADLPHLAQCPKLRELDLSRVTAGSRSEISNRFDSVNAADVAEGLSGCPALERLSVAWLRAPIEQIVPPGGLPRLIGLDISCTELTNNSVARLPALFPRLSALSMEGCCELPLDCLVGCLPRLRHLHSLDIRKVPHVTDALLDKLNRCPLTKLRISLDDSKISAGGIARMANNCRSLKLVWLETEFDVSDTIRDISMRLSPHRARTVGFVRGWKENAKLSMLTSLDFVSTTVDWNDTDISAL